MKTFRIKDMRRRCGIQPDRNGCISTGWEVYFPSALTPGGWHNPANWWPEYETTDERFQYSR